MKHRVVHQSIGAERSEPKYRIPDTSAPGQFGIGANLVPKCVGHFGTSAEWVNSFDVAMKNHGRIKQVSTFSLIVACALL